MENDNIILTILALFAGIFIIRTLIGEFLGLDNLDKQGNPLNDCKVHKWEHDTQNRMVCGRCHKRPGQ